MNELQFSIVYGSPATTVVLTHSPDGWDDNFIEIQRSKDFHGFMTTFIPTLKFVKDGATLLRTLFYTPLPYSQKVYLTVDKLDKIDLTYSQIFYGEIKMDTFVDFDNYVQVTVAEGGLSILLKQNMDKTFDMPLLFAHITVHTAYPSVYYAPLGAGAVCYLQPKELAIALFNYITYSPYPSIKVTGVISPTSANSTYKVAGSYNGEYYYVDITNSYIIFLSQSLMAGYWVMCAGTTPNESAVNYAHQDYDRLYYGYIWGEHGSWMGGGYSSIIDYTQQITGNIYKISTDVLNSLDDALVITQGYFMRTHSIIPSDGWTHLNCSMMDFFKSMDTILSIGMSIQLVGGIETLIFKSKDYFYDNTNEIENIGEVGDDFRLSLWENAINSVKIGYPKQDYTLDNTNEINSESIYSTIQNLFQRELDLVSKFRADSTGFEEITSGNAADNDIFFANIFWTGSKYKLVEDKARRISNNLIITTKCKNTAITPQRCLIVNQNYLNSLIYGVSNDKWILSMPVKYRTAGVDKSNVVDSESSTDSGTTWVQERTGMAISDGTKFLLPFVFEFQGKVSEDFTTNYKANQNGYITFTYNGETYKGFIYYAKYKPSGKTNCTFKLISTPDNDLTKLIR